MNPAIAAIGEVLRQNQSFVLTTHVNPDGDGLGSELALAEWLRSIGKQVHVINHSETPSAYKFLDPEKTISTFQESTHAPLLANADVIIVLDMNDTGRLRSMQGHVVASNAVKVCIDHHMDPSPFAQHYFIDVDATSTGEMIYRLLLQLDNTPLSESMARALYCAIMTDTGSFRYPRVDPEIFRVAAHLVELGADPVTIYGDVYEQWSPGRIQLLGAALNSLETFYDGRLACIHITREMLQTSGTREEDTDNFTSYPMSIGGVVAGILLLEVRDGIKISFRSKGDIPVNVLAKEFGGGGHKNAAGGRVESGTIMEVKRNVIAASRKFVDNTVHLNTSHLA